VNQQDAPTRPPFVPNIWKDPVGFVGFLLLLNLLPFVFQLGSAIYGGHWSILGFAAGAIYFFTIAMLMELQHVLKRLVAVEEDYEAMQAAKRHGGLPARTDRA
jgi:hypothetical protein